MADVEHSLLTGASLHEPKGVAAAAANRVYVSDGVGSGSWAQVSSSVLATAANPFAAQLLHVQHQEASGTDGGSFTAGAYRTRTLNTAVTNEITGASLASNQITLPAGTYWIDAVVTSHAVGENKIKLRNITDGSDTKIGMLATDGDIGVNTTVSLRGRFTIAAQKVFEIQHRCSSGQSTNGFGESCTYGDLEIYADVCIWKIA